MSKRRSLAAWNTPAITRSWASAAGWQCPCPRSDRCVTSIVRAERVRGGRSAPRKRWSTLDRTAHGDPFVSFLRQILFTSNKDEGASLHLLALPPWRNRPSMAGYTLSSGAYICFAPRIQVQTSALQRIAEMQEGGRTDGISDEP